AGIAAELVIMSAPLTGLSSEEAQILRANMSGQTPAFFAGLLAASMLIGALGVIMDVGISIASACWELSQTDKQLNAAQLYEKGMNVGRDIMGSMVCTLVLAYSGSALPLLLLMSTMPSMKLVNLDLVASEIAAALTGSLGLVCTIPLTAFAAARLMAAGGNSASSGRAGTGSNSKDPFAQLDNLDSIDGKVNVS
ncbi:MAG: YibE/F family protein, partial [Mycobacteriaceae bacterium]|nr:YibE/F family protein [Mycobacteriaceae bacterium]